MSLILIRNMIFLIIAIQDKYPDLIGNMWFMFIFSILVSRMFAALPNEYINRKIENQ